MKYYIGVDGGGTSTKTTIIDENGHEVAQGSAGPGSYTAIGLEYAIANILLSIDNALNDTKITTNYIAGIACGLASIDTLQDHQTVYEPLQKELVAKGFLCPIVLVNDAVIAMRAATEDKNAILLIMGTGANCYGKNQNKQEVWVSGLDYLLSDEAGGYSIGLKALRSAVRSADGRDQKTMLEDMVKKELGVTDIREIKDIVYKPNFKKKDVASFSTLVFKAHSSGDLTATKIIYETVEEGMLMLVAAHKRLSINLNPFTIILVGGVAHEKTIQSMLTSQIHKEYPQAKIIFTMQKSSRGAALLARDSCR